MIGIVLFDFALLWDRDKSFVIGEHQKNAATKERQAVCIVLSSIMRPKVFKPHLDKQSILLAYFMSAIVSMFLVASLSFPAVVQVVSLDAILTVDR